MKHTYYLAFFLLLASLYSSALSAQRLDISHGEILVQFKMQGEEVIRAFAQRYQNLRSQPTQFRVDRCVSDPVGVWSFRFDWTRISEEEMLRIVRRDPAVAAAQLNRYLQLRTRPNDPNYNQQYHLFNTGQNMGTQGIDLDLEAAWDVTTGGVTAAGDTIVVCVIDNGQDLDHPDFEGNLWVNRNEIPNNGIDDDDNGYVDDYRGWNVASQNDAVDQDNFHGTPIAGLIGARGNNGLGVAGINWNVKLMTVVGGFGEILESRIVEAYSYALTQRKLYNETGGEKGAFIVATNTSWGLSRIEPDEFPIWCATYDSLGRYGVLNAAATDNSDLDVDQVGDIPTACPSNYMVAVTNVDNTGQKVGDAAFGATSIDLGAFGEQVFTTSDAGSYGSESGTSFATPMVTGAIALLYSAPCPTLSVLSEVAPQEAALLVRDLLERGVDLDASLGNITATGGRLNINNSLQLLVNECSSCPPLARVRSTAVGLDGIQLSWVVNDSVNRVDLRYRKTGTNDFIVLNDVSSPVQISGLDLCTEYEFELEQRCRDGSDLVTEGLFHTEGCCEAPDEIDFDFIGFEDALLRWNAIPVADSYTVRYRAAGSTTPWTEVNRSAASVGIRDLDTCTVYELQVQSICAGEPSGFGISTSFRTRGCGACLEADYCVPTSLTKINAEGEWIAGVRLNDLDNRSGAEGYSDFTGTTASTQLKRGDSYLLTLEPAYSGFNFGEYFEVWIDYDQDGFFTSLDVLFDAGTVTDTAISSLVQIPADVPTGITRMRVVMNFQEAGGPCPSNSSDFFGEVEDYCVEIVDEITSTYDISQAVRKLDIFPNPVRSQLQLHLDLQHDGGIADLQLYNAHGQLQRRRDLGRLGSGTHSFVLSTADLPPGVYFLRLHTELGIISRRIVKQ